MDHNHSVTSDDTASHCQPREIFCAADQLYQNSSVRGMDPWALSREDLRESSPISSIAPSVFSDQSRRSESPYQFGDEDHWRPGETRSCNCEQRPTASKRIASPIVQHQKSDGRGNSDIRPVRFLSLNGVATGSREPSPAQDEDLYNYNAEPLYVCPFCAHDPDRYLGVENSCTRQPGLAWKQVYDHLFAAHCATRGCLYCDRTWDDVSSWDEQLERHILSGACKSSFADRLKQPEIMTPRQLASLQREDEALLNQDEEWISLFMRLFPNEFPLPSPRFQPRLPSYKTDNPPQRATTWPITVVSGVGTGREGHRRFTLTEQFDSCYSVPA